MNQKDYTLLVKTMRQAKADSRKTIYAPGVAFTRERLAAALEDDSPGFERADFIAATGGE